MNDCEMKPLEEYLLEKRDAQSYNRFAIANELDEPQDELRERLGAKLTEDDFSVITEFVQAEVAQEIWETRRDTMVRMLSLISSSKRPALEVDLLYLTMSQGLLENKGIQSTISRKYKVSRQYISKRILDLCDELGIVNPSGRGQKARDLYREVQRVSVSDCDRLSQIRESALEAIREEQQ